MQGSVISIALSDMSFAGTLSAVVKRKQHQGDRRFLLTVPNQIATFNFWQAWVGGSKERTKNRRRMWRKEESESWGGQQQAKSQGRSQGGKKTPPRSALVSALQCRLLHFLEFRHHVARSLPLLCISCVTFYPHLVAACGYLLLNSALWMQRSDWAPLASLRISQLRRAKHFWAPNDWPLIKC